MDRQFPYTNLHDLNIDWILQIIKEFQENYTSIDNMLHQIEADLTQAQTLLSQIDTATQAAIAAITENKNNAISALNTLYTSLESALDEYEATKEEELNSTTNDLLTSLITATNAHIAELQNITNQQLQAINTAGQNEIQLLYTEAAQTRASVIADISALPPYVVDGVAMVKSVLFQTRTYPELKQGTYINGEYDNNFNHVCTDIIHRPENATITVLVSGGASNSLEKICYWNKNDSYAESQALYPTQEETLTIPATAKDIAFVFCNDAQQATTITPTSITVEFVWQAPVFNKYVSTERKQEFSVSEKMQGRENINAAHNDMLCYGYRQIVTDNWESGVYSTRVGSKITSNTYIRHDVFVGIATGHARIFCDPAYEMLLYAWTRQGDYVGNLKQNFTFTKAETGYLWVEDFDFSFFPDYIIKIGLRRKDLVQPTITEGLNVLFYLYTDTTLTELHKAADAAAVGSLIQALDARVTALEQAAGLNRQLAENLEQKSEENLEQKSEEILKEIQE